MVNTIAGGIFCIILFGFWCLLRFSDNHEQTMRDAEEEK